MKSLFEKYMGSSAFLWNVPGDGGAPSPTPGASSTPAPSTPSAGATDDGASNSSGDEFSSFGSEDLDSIDLGPDSGLGQDPPVVPQPAPVVPTPAPAVPAAPATAAPVAPVVPPPAPTPQTASAPPGSALETLVQNVDANSPALVDWLAQNAFALSKEDADAFELDAVATVPKLMARVAVNNMKSTMNIIKNLVPQLINQEVERLTGTKAKASEAINEFYTSNPHLNEKDHGALVNQWANAFRAANPKASRKEAIEYVGRAVSLQAGITPGTPLAAPRAAPFAPARPGARPVVTNTEATDTPFAGLGEAFDD